MTGIIVCYAGRNALFPPLLQNHMLIKDLLTLYRNDAFVRLIGERLKSDRPDDYHLQIKGLTGSLDAVLAAALFLNEPKQTL